MCSEYGVFYKPGMEFDELWGGRLQHQLHVTGYDLMMMEFGLGDEISLPDGHYLDDCGDLTVIVRHGRVRALLF